MDSTLQYWATWGSAALGLPNGAESGVWKGDWSNMELLRFPVIVHVIQYSYIKARVIVNCTFVQVFELIGSYAVENAARSYRIFDLHSLSLCPSLCPRGPNNTQQNPK
jgi:hypothetical protein